MYTSIYCREIPPLIKQLLETPEMQRLSDVGMNCGCEYTSFPIYKQARMHYTRYIHSIGVANIIWNFTEDITQTVAGLFHDIATPAFAHTIDFMNQDYLEQESTESRTREIIENSSEIKGLLAKNHISADDVADYHMYPIADNDTPKLSADRLEYALGDGYLIQNVDLEQIRRIYQDIIVMENEAGEWELGFKSIEMAKAFTEISLWNSYWFVSDEDRFAMQYLADMIKNALQSGCLTEADLYRTEKEVIRLLQRNETIRSLWKQYTQISSVTASDSKPIAQYSVKVSAKKRYIDPLVLTPDEPKRISKINSETGEKIQQFLRLDFNKFLYIS